MRKIAYLAPILLAAAGGWALCCWPVKVLELANDERGLVARYELGPGERFSITYQHSLYDRPVTEEFILGPRGMLEVVEVRSASGAVLEYFGFTDGQQRQAVHRQMKSVFFRVAMGTPQKLTLGRKDVSFLRFGEPGDRIRVRWVSVPLGTFLLGQAAQGSG